MPEIIDQAFKIVKSEGSNFYIWRIENFKPVPVPKENYGHFFEGDAYIVYSSSGQRSQHFDGKSEIHIHFWLGSKCSRDEAGTAAIKSVELDDYLGGYPIQHREVQGHESPRFKSYFKTGMRILAGGVASGFKHVTDDSKPKLFKIKGKRCPTLTEMSSISWQHFNCGDVFILQTKDVIYVWIGKESNYMERLQGSKVAVQLRDEKGKASIVFVDDGKEQQLEKKEKEGFENHLPLSKRVVKPAEKDEDDNKVEFTVRGTIKLYLCSDAGGTFTMKQVKEGTLQQSDLDSKDSFIIDNDMRGIWVWVGRKSTVQEKKKAMTNAQEFARKKNNSNNVPVTRVIDGAEPAEFKMLFSSWRDPNASVDLKARYTVGRTAKATDKSFDARTLHDSPKLAADTQLIDDGKGKATVWRLRNKQLEIVPADQFGVFFAGDCYLIHYMYNVYNKAHHLLYFWLGTNSSQDERGTIAWHTVKKDDELNGIALQTRVVQSKEPPHFLTVFKDHITVFKGGYASSFDGKGARDVDISSTFLMQVRAGERNQTRAVQVECKASSLNTNDVFVLRTPKSCYVWRGKGSTDTELERGKAIASKWSTDRKFNIIGEGQENSEFWHQLGGKGKYADDPRLSDSSIWKPARLFHCSDASGSFRGTNKVYAEEIFDFCQNDLIPEDVMVLDANSTVFVWIGQGANQRERRESMKLIHEYLKSDPSNRDPDTPIMVIPQGNEPPSFKGYFGVWDADLWKNSDYNSLRQQLEGKQNKEIKTVKMTDITSGTIVKKNYTLDYLKKVRAESAPDDLDVSHKELYLSDEEFFKTFKMKKNDFQELPTWRQANLKKSAGLF